MVPSTRTPRKRPLLRSNRHLGCWLHLCGTLDWPPPVQRQKRTGYVKADPPDLPQHGQLATAQPSFALLPVQHFFFGHTAFAE